MKRSAIWAGGSVTVIQGQWRVENRPAMAPPNRPLAVLMCPWVASTATKHVASHWLDERPCEFELANKALTELEALHEARQEAVRATRDLKTSPNKTLRETARRNRKEAAELEVLTRLLREHLIRHMGNLLSQEV